MVMCTPYLSVLSHLTHIHTHARVHMCKISIWSILNENKQHVRFSFWGNLDKSLFFFVPQFPLCKLGLIIAPTS